MATHAHSTPVSRVLSLLGHLAAAGTIVCSGAFAVALATLI